jgi:adenylate cyclase
MRLKLKQQIWEWRSVLFVAPCVATFAIAVEFLAFFQLLEWVMLDAFFRARPSEPLDSRIVIVTVDESDLKQLGGWPICDHRLAEVLTNLKSYQPRVIGLDLYRDFPVGTGYESLVQVFLSTPNLIGVEKVVGTRIDPPPTLKEQGQVGIVDMVLDADGKVRRAVLGVHDSQTETLKLNLAVKLSLLYLETEGIELEDHDIATHQRVLGKAVFFPFKPNHGGYVRADAGGYQILINFRGLKEDFQTVSISDVLENRIPPDLVSDRVVLIGATAESLNDFFLTPYNHKSAQTPHRTSGVIIHANIVSQILSAALDGRRMIRVWSTPIQGLWMLFWSFMGATGFHLVLQLNGVKKNLPFTSMILSQVLGAGLLVTSGFLLFLNGWWVTVAAPMGAFSLSAIALTIYEIQTNRRLAYIDSLTQISNRRYFDEYFEVQYSNSKSYNKRLSLILCDVDYFKAYNDTYGHQAGDECLRQIAQGIAKGIRNQDILARYGGEEFAVILPDTTSEMALEIAEEIALQIAALKIKSANPQVSQYVTLSCGIASTRVRETFSPFELIAGADASLYEAKRRGRNCRVVYQGDRQPQQG